MENKFDWRIIGETDRAIARGLFCGKLPQPDLTIAPDGNPYLYRWYLHPKNSDQGNLYFHIQVADDPERPLHDHPWHNTSVILAGGYREIIAPPDTETHTCWDLENPQIIQRYAGDVVSRPAAQPHRLLLPKNIPYTMTIFITGPKEQDWGFYYPDGWRSFEEVTRTQNGVSVHVTK